jgi:hypothetical protein
MSCINESVKTSLISYKKHEQKKLHKNIASHADISSWKNKMKKTYNKNAKANKLLELHKVNHFHHL